MRDPDEDRIRAKAHELWLADGQPHGRDEEHWVQAREIIAIQDSQGDTLLPAATGAEDPVEPADEALRNLADFPNLTDQGENLLTSTDRETTQTTANPGGKGTMPSVEVPTSDQPGIPSDKAKTSVKPAPSAKPVPAKAKNKSSGPSVSEPIATKKTAGKTATTRKA